MAYLMAGSLQHDAHASLTCMGVMYEVAMNDHIPSAMTVNMGSEKNRLGLPYLGEPHGIFWLHKYDIIQHSAT